MKKVLALLSIAFLLGGCKTGDGYNDYFGNQGYGRGGAGAAAPADERPLQERVDELHQAIDRSFEAG